MSRIKEMLFRLKDKVSAKSGLFLIVCVAVFVVAVLPWITRI